MKVKISATRLHVLFLPCFIVICLSYRNNFFFLLSDPGSLVLKMFYIFPCR